MMTDINNKKTKVFTLILCMCLIFSLSSCTTMRLIEGSKTEKQINELAIGDKVKITTKQKDVYEFIIDYIDDRFIRGEGVEISHDDIDTISVKDKDKIRNEIVKIGVGIGVAATYFVYVMSKAIGK